jgi:hypothetical protein
MGEQFDHELNRSIARIEEAVAPYTRFVRASQTEMEQMRDDLAAIRNGLLTLRHKIDGARAEAPVAAAPEPAPIALPDGSDREDA